MTNMTQEIWNILARHPAIQKDLARDLINVRALAKYLVKRYNLGIGLDAVISAIRRYELSKVSLEYNKAVEELFKESKILTKNDIGCIITKRNKDTQEAIQRIINEIEQIKIVKTESKIKLITDNKRMSELYNVFKKQDILKIEDNLGELCILIDIKAEETKGVMARIANELLVSDINIEDIIINLPEILVYVMDIDLLKAHESLLSLSKKKLAIN